MPNFRGYPGVGQSPNQRLQQVQTASVVNANRQGKVNLGPELTLRASETTTDLIDPRLSFASLVLLDPLTANAAAELAAGTIYAAAAGRVKGACTFTHANEASTDRTFRTVILG